MTAEQGRPDNNKCIERLYRKEGLAVRRRSRKRVARARVPRPEPVGPNERWSMDFVRDSTAGGRGFRAREAALRRRRDELRGAELGG